MSFVQNPRKHTHTQNTNKINSKSAFFSFSITWELLTEISMHQSHLCSFLNSNKTKILVDPNATKKQNIRTCRRKLCLKNQSRGIWKGWVEHEKVLSHFWKERDVPKTRTCKKQWFACKRFQAQSIWLYAEECFKQRIWTNQLIVLNQLLIPHIWISTEEQKCMGGSCSTQQHLNSQIQ